mmetsp:Transcript_2900/g.7623  ORF Transcript_2900/g.7623 Transcript_2900/m.7623 type:complete len:425 (+) Transcript_2900:400-1674(+)
MVMVGYAVRASATVMKCAIDAPHDHVIVGPCIDVVPVAMNGPEPTPDAGGSAHWLAHSNATSAPSAPIRDNTARATVPCGCEWRVPAASRSSSCSSPDGIAPWRRALQWRRCRPSLDAAGLAKPAESLAESPSRSPEAGDVAASGSLNCTVGGSTACAVGECGGEGDDDDDACSGGDRRDSIVMCADWRAAMNVATRVIACCRNGTSARPASAGAAVRPPRAASDPPAVAATPDAAGACAGEGELSAARLPSDESREALLGWKVSRGDKPRERPALSSAPDIDRPMLSTAASEGERRSGCRGTRRSTPCISHACVSAARPWRAGVVLSTIVRSWGGCTATISSRSGSTAATGTRASARSSSSHSQQESTPSTARSAPSWAGHTDRGLEMRGECVLVPAAGAAERACRSVAAACVVAAVAAAGDV